MGWQARKSEATRNQIITAAIRCIVESSYSNTTTMRIAEKAGLSRGAMLHHFPSKIDIIRAVVDYLHNKRLQAFRRSIKEMPEGADRVRLAVRSYWEHVNHPLYIAIFELAVAARTDEELRQILVPAQQAFDREWYKTAREVFPEWQSDPQGLRPGPEPDPAIDGGHVHQSFHARTRNRRGAVAGTTWKTACASLNPHPDRPRTGAPPQRVDAPRKKTLSFTR